MMPSKSLARVQCLPRNESNCLKQLALCSCCVEYREGYCLSSVELTAFIGYDAVAQAPVMSLQATKESDVHDAWRQPQRAP